MIMTPQQDLRAEIQGALQMLDSAHSIAVQLYRGPKDPVPFDLWDAMEQAKLALRSIDDMESDEDRAAFRHGHHVSYWDFAPADYGR